MNIVQIIFAFLAVQFFSCPNKTCKKNKEGLKNNINFLSLCQEKFAKRFSEMPHKKLNFILEDFFDLSSLQGVLWGEGV